MKLLRSALPALLLLATAASFKGPPWISIETPVNPYDRTTKGAFLLVHAFHHGTAVGLPVTGQAIGIVGGRRKQITLSLTPTSRTGVYALRNQWGETGEWTLILTASQGKDDAAQAMVKVSGNRVFAVEVPTRTGDGIEIPRPFTAAEIEASLSGRVVARAR